MQNKILSVFVIVACLVLGIYPYADRLTWFLENLPVFIILPLTIYLQPSLRLSTFTLYIMVFHALVLMVGGHYSYAEVPVGFWAQEVFGFSRNHYDRLGHFMQGFGPGIVLWEILSKKSAIKSAAFRGLVVISMALAFSALYELIEWWSAVILGEGADAFLGTQGDVWDTQWDMFLALLGSIAAIVAQWLRNSSVLFAKGDI